MMDFPLTVTAIARHAERIFPRQQIVSVTMDHPRHRQSFAETFSRARRLANALARAGMRRGDRVATLAWNDFRHLELYHAVSCAGHVLHTVNPRLFDDQIVYMVNHAEDRLVFADPAFVPILERLQPKLPGVEAFVLLTDDSHLPQTTLRNACSYEALLARESDAFDWPELDEREACALCYTSGTTGNPKGVLYSHRAVVLHAYGSALVDSFGTSARDTVMPVVPLFHANGWGTAHACPMVGARMVMPGPKLGDPATLHALIEEEGVTCAAAVPTVWLGLVQYLASRGERLRSLKRVIIGGAACPRALMETLERDHGVRVHHAWGMTEMTPLGVVNSDTADTAALEGEEKWALRVKQGRPPFGVEIKITDDENRELPWDGRTFGALKVRGPWIVSDYFRAEERSPAFEADGWFGTGDVATIDERGYIQITDRTKDVIKSGGEWISSIELENLAIAHPAVAEAAAIAMPHEKWGERPLLVVVLRKGQSVTREELLKFFEGRIAKWSIPDDVRFVEEIPHTATGKISKVELRRRFTR
jgi:fatty-acyl-CoA synthase